MKCETWVIKAGSNTICAGGIPRIHHWMHQCAQLVAEDRARILWVTSGVLATAREFRSGSSAVLAERQALGAVGQALLLHHYAEGILRAGGLPAQFLYTYSHLQHPESRNQLKEGLQKALAWKAVAILNENDAVGTNENLLKDNDLIAAEIATLVSADRLVLVTDVDGVYTEDPRANPNAELIPHLSEAQLFDLLPRQADTAGSSRGKGGIVSKLQASAKATSRGATAWIVNGERENALLGIARNEIIGTKISGATL